MRKQTLKRLKRPTILIVGLGQIGGSLGLALVRRKIAGRVIGFDTNAAALRKAKRIGAIDEIARSLKAGVAEADLVILAAPIRKIIKMLPSVIAALPDNAAIIDVAGTKSEILETIKKCGRKVNYIGGHPIAGNEGHGMKSASPDHFDKAPFILVPGKGTTKACIGRVKTLVRSIGSRPIIMTAAKHDRLIALTSHLPYLVALALSSMADDERRKSPDIMYLMGGSYKSATRVASSHEDLILDMFLTNRTNLSKTIDRFIAVCERFRKLIKASDENGLRRTIRRIRKVDR